MKAYFEPARLALIPARHVHRAVAVLLAHVVQVPEQIQMVNGDMRGEVSVAGAAPLRYFKAKKWREMFKRIYLGMELISRRRRTTGSAQQSNIL